MNVGQMIKEIREKKGITITDLATRIGVSRSQMSRMENGERTIKVEVLSKIANVLKSPIDSFYSDAEKKNIQVNSEEVVIIDKNQHNLENYSEAEILEFIRLGRLKSKNNDT